MRSAPTHAKAVSAAIEAMDGTIAMARALVEGGRRIDLAGLDGEAGRLCAAVMALEPGEARRLRPALLALRQQIDGLAASLARD
jgi:hypothetical protein